MLQEGETVSFDVLSFNVGERVDSISAFLFTIILTVIYKLGFHNLEMAAGVFEEGFGDEHTLFVEHGVVTLENMEQAKLAAVAFAEYVS